MKLTPIKVRGKRKQSKRVAMASRMRSNSSDVLEQPAPKRSKKQHAKDTPRLLQLPQEMLERIFIGSKNLALPLVNHELHRRLSTNSIKYQLVGVAFGPTWDAWHGKDCYELHSYAGWAVDKASIDGDAAFQSAILACSWAKFDLLVEAHDIWIRKHAGNRPYFTVPTLSSERLLRAPEPGSVYELAYNTTIGPALSDQRPRYPNMSMRQKLGFDMRVFNSDVEPTTRRSGFEIAEIWPQGASTFASARLAMHLEIHPGAAIPDDLLTGPYASEEDDGDMTVGEEKVRRLFWLVRGGACLQDEQTWEATRAGFWAVVQLVSEFTYEGVSQTEISRRLQLATQLIFLFDILGVFSVQWPMYILVTAQDALRDLIHKMPQNSDHRQLLFLFCQILGHSMGREVWEQRNQHGGRWRRSRVPPGAEEVQQAHSVLRRFRAEVFLDARFQVFDR